MFLNCFKVIHFFLLNYMKIKFLKYIFFICDFNLYLLYFNNFMMKNNYSFIIFN